jgi:hypothetical protein
LYASNEIVIPPAGQTWQINTTIQTIKNNLNVGTMGINETKTINFSSGSYGEKTGLSRLEFSLIVLGTYNTVLGVVPLLGNKLKIIFNDNITYTHEDTRGTGINVNDGKINKILTVGGGMAGKTLKFKNLPGGAEGLEAGTVYRNGNQLMIV